ncbi:putative protein [Arabidopsis thaliana]|uniref:Probable disease resistance protein At4g27220 n=3 Tax=Arabidopsis thaliana TaxID=3702 RepID=DRL28_ARATH|nr:NB-ARC domain-containing disease resistance protein [Arabidopsis thaliana]O81825.1 RecName: Full=Probable disease resistance protein At4g27220 [Arabidopsis thaliana]ABE66093.1 disease resistance protein [Arabidopsis thaliana]AEE85312.1 NB-ARC domain-containing disease resistance protein [Arabidopsis thaliana]CAA19716.1 putative protein [Arabidopsis thaliana]CAB79577.1 putative protein [Arabidopsis thaliana]|eukprot:NP_194452.1 NB-ARC domain-containing disease resistance protein [Arabidopsis thaliana]
MFRSNARALNRALERLKNVQTKVNEALKRSGIQEKSLERKLRIWLRKVEENVPLGELILEKRSSCAIWLSDKDVEILEKVKRLEEQGQDLIKKISVNKSSREIVERVLGPSFHPQKTALEMLDKLKDCLKKKNVQKIGVWGMGGVGKTTLVRTLNNDLLKYAATQQFALVIWVTVSKDFDLKRVQMDIAKRLGKRFTREQMNQLGLTICERLIDLKNFLLILDDVWHPIDLDQLGIPLALERSKDSKVVLTSRRLEVCQQMMTNENIKVACLQEKEAWELFCHNVGEVANSDNVKPIAKDVSHECCGLPLAIITIGRTLRGKPQVEVWKHTLNLLKRSAPSIDTEEKIFGTLKLSYDFLQDNMKSCFLFCALFPEDYSIKVSELIMYWVAEGLLDGQHHYEDMMNEGVTLVERLKDSCLLEDGDSCDTVKMHDVVRDFAIWFMSSQGEGFHSLVMAGRGLIEFPQDKFVSSVQRVSLMANKLERLPNNVIEGVETLVLLLQGNSHVKEVPNGFLQAFPNLRILDLSGVRIRTLPDSFSNLHSLRSLVLRNCKKLRNLPSLESLVKLQFLDLHESAIRELPRGLEALSSLRYICVSNTYQLQSIPAGTILQLSSLEVLDMAGSAYSWGIKGEEREGQATLDEVTCLPHLQFLAIKLLDVLSFSYEFDSLTKRLTKFQFLFSPIRSVSPPGTGEGCLAISDVNVSNASIGWLLQHVTSLDLNYCEGLNGMFENLVTKSKSSFVAMKALSIHYFPSLSLASGCESQLDLFPNLEELSLDNVNLESIGELNGFLGMRLQKLKLLQVSGCRQLKRLFSDQILAGTLPNLQEIKVVSCLRLEELFNFSSVPVDFCAESLLPKLTVIKLKYLPQLRSLCNDRVVLESLEHLEVESCESLKNLPFVPGNTGMINEQMAWEYMSRTLG